VCADDDAWVTVPKFVGRALATMGRAVVDNPEHAARRTIRLLLHNLIHQASERDLAGTRFTPAEDLGAMDIPRGQILQRSTTRVFVLDASRLERTGRHCLVAAAADLDARLLIGAEHVLVRPEWLALPGARVEIEHGPSQFQKVWIARKDPAPVPPGAQRIVL
jgi:hypothetical protein